jgi:hypothetical protein
VRYDEPHAISPGTEAIVRIGATHAIRKDVMLLQLLVGLLVSAIAIMVHALATVGAIGTARAVARRQGTFPRLHLMSVMVATVLVLMLAHTVEVVVWSLSYGLFGAAPAGTDLLYFAFVNYTTLGYGDVTPVKAWQLLGPMAAMNGILMFGWSTAVLFEVLLKTIEQFGAIVAPDTMFSAGDRG